MLVSSVKKIIVSASLASVFIFQALPSMASAPMAKSPAPGYFRFMLGKFEVTAINDGTADLDVGKLLAQPVEKTNAELEKSFLKEPVETSVNTFLINTGSKLVLVDTGAGVLFGPTVGKFISNLKASGYEPSQIDDIYITHLHSDHAGGLLLNGAIAFPNALVHTDKRESDFWLNTANMNAAPEDQKPFYQNAMNVLNPYIAAKKFVPFNGSGDLVPGVKAYSGYGHTAGHTVYVVESEGQKLFLIGDLIHVTAVQLDHPEVTIAFDTDQKAAAQARDKVFTEAAKDGVLVGGAHIQFPGLGHLRKQAKGYEWIPINFTQMHGVN